MPVVLALRVLLVWLSASLTASMMARSAVHLYGHLVVLNLLAVPAALARPRQVKQ